MELIDIPQAGFGFVRERSSSSMPGGIENANFELGGSWNTRSSRILFELWDDRGQQITGSVSIQQTLGRTINSTVNILESIVTAFGGTISVGLNEALTNNATLSRIASFFRTITRTLTFSDSVTGTGIKIAAASETVTPGDSITSKLSALVNIAVTVNPIAAITRKLSSFIVISHTSTISESLDAAKVTLVEISQTLTNTGNVAISQVLQRTVTPAIALTGNVAAKFSTAVSIAQSITASEVFSRIQNSSVVIVQSITNSELLNTGLAFIRNIATINQDNFVGNNTDEISFSAIDRIHFIRKTGLTPGQRINEILIQVGTSKILANHFALYDDNGSDLPGDLLYEAPGDYDLTSEGTNTTFRHSISFTSQPKVPSNGVVWIAYHRESGSTPDFRGQDGSFPIADSVLVADAPLYSGGFPATISGTTYTVRPERAYFGVRTQSLVGTISEELLNVIAASHFSVSIDEKDQSRSYPQPFIEDTFGETNTQQYQRIYGMPIDGIKVEDGDISEISVKYEFNRATPMYYAIYDSDGVGGRPGTLLWEGSQNGDVAPDDGNRLFILAVSPGVTPPANGKLWVCVYSDDFNQQVMSGTDTGGSADGDVRIENGTVGGRTSMPDPAPTMSSTFGTGWNGDFRIKQTNTKGVTPTATVTKSKGQQRSTSESNIITDSVSRILSALAALAISIIPTSSVVTREDIVKTINEALTNTGNVAVKLSAFRTMLENNTAISVISRKLSAFRAISANAISLIDSVLSNKNHPLSIPENVSIGETLAAKLSAFRTLFDTVSKSGIVSRLRFSSRINNEAITDTDSVVSSRSSFRTVVFSIISTDAISRQISAARSSVENLVSTDSLFFLVIIFRTITESVTKSSVISRKLSAFKQLSETGVISGIVTGSKILNQRFVSEALSTLDSVSKKLSVISTIFENLTNADSVTSFKSVRYIIVKGTLRATRSVKRTLSSNKLPNKSIFKVTRNAKNSLSHNRKSKSNLKSNRSAKSK